MSTLCGFNNDRLAVTMLPATLNRRSDAELVPQTHKYLRASFDNDGYPLACILHHWRGSASSSIPGAETYQDISRSIRAAGVVASGDVAAVFFTCPRSFASDFFFFFGTG